MWYDYDVANTFYSLPIALNTLFKSGVGSFFPVIRYFME